MVLWVAKVESLAAWEQATMEARSDAGWRELVREGESQGLFQFALKDTFYQIIE